MFIGAGIIVVSPHTWASVIFTLPSDRDIHLYDRETKQLLPTPGLNSKDDDYDPCVIVLPVPK